MKNKYLKFALFSVVFLFCFIFNVNALPTEENKTFTYDYDDFSEFLELGDYIEEVNIIIEHLQSIETNKGLVFLYRPDLGFYFYAYGLASGTDNLNVLNWYNLTNNLRYIQTNWSFSQSNSRYCGINLELLSISNPASVQSFLNSVDSCVTSNTVSSYRYDLGYVYEAKGSSYVFDDYELNPLAPIIYVSDNITLKYDTTNIFTSGQTGYIWKNLDIVSNGSTTTYTIGDTVPTWYEMNSQPAIDYEIDGTALIDYTDYIYNQINWLDLKTDILEAIELYNNSNSNKRLIINWIENRGIEILVVENSLDTLNFYLGSKAVTYDDNDIISGIENIQGLSFKNKKYVSTIVDFDDYFDGVIEAIVDGSLDYDLSSVSSKNYERTRITTCLRSHGCYKPYLYDKDNMGVYPIYVSSSIDIVYDIYSFEFEGDIDYYGYYWDTYDFVINGSSHTINDIASYHFKPIFNLYSFTTTNGAGSGTNNCGVGTICYFENFLEKNNIQLEGPIDSLLLIPLKIIQSLNNQISSECSPVIITLPFINSNITLPCIRDLFTSWGIYSMIELIIVAVNILILYNYFVYLFHWFEKLLQFNVHVDFLNDYYSKGKYR